MRGVTLAGETRYVVALFVDITGSTALTDSAKAQPGAVLASDVVVRRGESGRGAR